MRLGHRGILVSGGTSLGLGSTTPRAPAEGSGGTAGHTAKSYSGAVSATVAQRDDNLAAGYEALASGDWGAARDAFERALASGDSPEALDGLGRALWWLREERDAVVQRERAYAGFRRDGDLARAARIALWLSRERERRRIPDPAAGYPGLRMVLVHTIAHALMRRLALECGYSQASIRERLYALPAEDPYGPMAGILLYTAAPDSEGTLGGLVALGEPEELARHLRGALRDAGLCASDPLCAEHAPDREGITLHGAACHACLFAPETSCERGNRYLDRAVLTELITALDIGFLPRS